MTRQQTFVSLGATLFGWGAALMSPGLVDARIYPSAETAWILPGGWQAPSDPDTAALYPDAAAVKQWEAEHADLAVGADYGLQLNQHIDAISYIYNQKLEFDPPLNQSEPKELYLRRKARESNEVYEDFFLHLREDTTLSIDDATHAADTSFNRRPLLVGYTNDALHAGFWLYQQPPWNVQAWKRAAQGGAVYVYQFEPFDELTVQLAHGATSGQLQLEYPSAVDAQGLVQQWSPLPLIEDGTLHLRQSGRLRFSPPADWLMAATHDGTGESYGHGPYFSSVLLRDQARMYVVRLRWLNGQDDGPYLDDVLLRRWQPEMPGGERVIPGWDAANDSNGDGYVDDAEFASRSNLQASARFRYEARAAPFGRMWSASSSWCAANLFNPALREHLAHYYRDQWSAKMLQGGYNDDLFKTVGPVQYAVTQGGHIAERAWSVQTQAAFDDYNGAMMQALNRLRQVTGVRWIGGNIAGRTLFTDASQHPFTTGLSLFLREDYLHASSGLAGNTGLARTWGTSALAAQDLASIVQISSRFGRNRLLGNTELNWHADHQSIVAQYYLIQHPDETLLHGWNHSYNYGSQNTHSWTYWKAGVPNNMAYQPSAILAVDIGQPSNVIPQGYSPMPYISRTQDGDYTVLGSSTDTRLTHPDLLPNGQVQILPTHAFYLQRSADHPNVPGLPLDMILARQYEDGLVLYRTDFIGGQQAFMQTQSGPVPLPGRYRRVQADGTLGPNIREIDLAGYEGAVLKHNPSVLDSIEDLLE